MMYRFGGQWRARTVPTVWLASSFLKKATWQLLKTWWVSSGFKPSPWVNWRSSLFHAESEVLKDVDCTLSQPWSLQMWCEMIAAASTPPCRTNGPAPVTSVTSLIHLRWRSKSVWPGKLLRWRFWTVRFWGSHPCIGPLKDVLKLCAWDVVRIYSRRVRRVRRSRRSGVIPGMARGTGLWKILVMSFCWFLDVDFPWTSINNELRIGNLECPSIATSVVLNQSKPPVFWPVRRFTSAIFIPSLSHTPQRQTIGFISSESGDCLQHL